MTKGVRITLNTTVGFVPLILYWCLESEWALYAGGVAVLLGIIKMYTKREWSVLTIYLAGYMLLMNALYFFTHWEWLISIRHILSYLALALLALGSLYFDRPYTMYEARKAYAASFEESPLFLEVNILITKIWGATYVLAALLRSLSDGGMVIAGIQLMIVGAILASIKIPDWMPEA